MFMRWVLASSKEKLSTVGTKGSSSWRSRGTCPSVTVLDSRVETWSLDDFDLFARGVVEAAAETAFRFVTIGAGVGGRAAEVRLADDRVSGMVRSC
jgi:hypothetical protein